VKSEMMAAVLYGKEHLQVEPVAVPNIDRGDLLVRVKVALTCGTDVKVFRRGYHARMIVPPAVFGHELAGDVVAVGEDVTTFQVGQRVVSANSAPCNNCFFCRRGLENLCEDLLFNNGAYAEYIRIPARIVERNTYQIPAGVGYHDAALIEPLACVLRGLEETGVREGDTVTIIGLGPIGLMFVRIAKLYNTRVIAIGRRKTQLDRAAAMGADEVICTEQIPDPRKTVREMTGGRGTDIAIEAVGRRHGAPRRHRQLLRWLPQRQPRQPGYIAAALFRDHLQGKLSSHSGLHPEGAGHRFGRTHHRAAVRQQRGAAGEFAGSDAPPDEP
jgi:L-iditol 2-dehydrogenase